MMRRQLLETALKSTPESSAYNGKTVLVTGEEGLDERWPNTPVLTIHKIQVVK